MADTAQERSARGPQRDFVTVDSCKPVWRVFKGVQE